MKNVTHFLAIGIAGLAALLASNPALVQVVARKYPAVAVISTAVIGLAALYHNPKEAK